MLLPDPYLLYLSRRDEIMRRRIERALEKTYAPLFKDNLTKKELVKTLKPPQ